MLSSIGWAAMALASRLKPGGVIVNEHVLTRDQLRVHVDALGRWFDFIHPDELPARLRRRGRKPFCLLTFDDCHRSNATVVAPELERLGVPAAFYVVTGFVGTDQVLWFTLYNLLRKKLGAPPPGLGPLAVKQLPHDLRLDRIQRACARHGVTPDLSDEDVTAMTWTHVRDLQRRGFVIGAHGETHAIMTRESRQSALDNIGLSIARVARETGAPCTTFAFPNGNYTAELARHAVRCGARLVMTAEPTWVDEQFPLWRLPRVQLFDRQDRATIELKIAVGAAGRWLPSGDGTGRVYRDINRLARARARREARSGERVVTAG